MTIDDTRRAYLALGRWLARGERDHADRGRARGIGTLSECGGCQETSLLTDAASLSLDCAVAEASRARVGTVGR
jgi:hypothetical protein